MQAAQTVAATKKSDAEAAVPVAQAALQAAKDALANATPETLSALRKDVKVCMCMCMCVCMCVCAHESQVEWRHRSAIIAAMVMIS